MHYDVILPLIPVILDSVSVVEKVIEEEPKDVTKERLIADIVMALAEEGHQASNRTIAAISLVIENGLKAWESRTTTTTTTHIELSGPAKS